MNKLGVAGVCFLIISSALTSLYFTLNLEYVITIPCAVASGVAGIICIMVFITQKCKHNKQQHQRIITRYPPQTFFEDMQEDLLDIDAPLYDTPTVNIDDVIKHVIHKKLTCPMADVISDM